MLSRWYWTDGPFVINHGVVPENLSPQGHLVFGHGIAQQVENVYRVVSHVESCFPGTLPRS
jgi:hypothetical protein